MNENTNKEQQLAMNQWLERQADLLAKISEYGTDTKFGAFLFFVATTGLFRALFYKMLLMITPRRVRIEAARQRMANGRAGFINAISLEPKATLPVHMAVTASYTFMVGKLDEPLYKETADLMYQIVRSARWKRVTSGLNTDSLDWLIEAYESDCDHEDED